MMAIKNVVFDFGGVLVDWNPRYFYRDLIPDPTELETFVTKIIPTRWNAQMDAGRPFADCIREQAAAHPSYAPWIRRYFEGFPRMVRDAVAPGVALLRAVTASGRYTPYGLTNWSAETFPPVYRRFEFFRLFTGIVVSGEERVLKPQPEIYRCLLSRYHLTPAECLFIDDNPNNVAGARRCGMAAECFADPARDAGRIAARLRISLPA